MSAVLSIHQNIHPLKANKVLPDLKNTKPTVMISPENRLEDLFYRVPQQGDYIG